LVLAISLGVEDFVLYTIEFRLWRNLICSCVLSIVLLFNYRYVGRFHPFIGHEDP
jgi:hypothetical protein